MIYGSRHILAIINLNVDSVYVVIIEFACEVTCHGTIKIFQNRVQSCPMSFRLPMKEKSVMIFKWPLPWQLAKSTRSEGYR